MRRLSILLIILLSTLAKAQTTGTSIEGFASRMAGNTASFNYSFEVKGDVPLTGKGAVKISGAAYHMTGNGLEIWCDGTTRWTVDASSKEAYIESVGDEGADYLTNPAMLLNALDSAFVISSHGNAVFNGKNTTAYTLRPAIEGTGLKETVLYLSGDCPAGASITIEDGTRTVFKMSSFAWGEMKEPSSYKFDPSSLGSSYVVTDLR